MNAVEQLQAWINEAYAVQKYNGEPVPQASIRRYRRSAGGAVATLLTGWTGVDIYFTGAALIVRLFTENGTQDLTTERAESVGYALMKAAQIKRMADAVVNVLVRKAA